MPLIERDLCLDRSTVQSGEDKEITIDPNIERSDNRSPNLAAISGTQRQTFRRQSLK